MRAYGPALDPARCAPKAVQHIDGVLTGNSTIRLRVRIGDKYLWLDFDAADRDGLFVFAEEIKRLLAEPMGGA